MIHSNHWRMQISFPKFSIAAVVVKGQKSKRNIEQKLCSIDT